MNAKRNCLGLVVVILSFMLASCGADTGGTKRHDATNGDTGPEDTNITADITQDTALDTDPITENDITDVQPDTVADTTSPPQDTSVPEVGPTIVGAHIEPLTVVISTQIGVPAATPLRFLMDYSDGSTRQIDNGVFWSSDEPLIANVDNTGLVSATGGLGGVITVNAVYANQSVNRDVRVQLSENITSGTLDPTTQGGLDSGNFNAGVGPLWEYPENETMFPAGMSAPLFQWNVNGNAYFKLLLTRGNEVSVTVYTNINQWMPSPAQWRAIGAGYGEPIRINIYGKQSLDPAAERFAGSELVVYTADAKLAGSVYYWQVATGDIMRIDEGATANASENCTDGVDNDGDGAIDGADSDCPSAVFTTNANSGNCRGCHTLTRDGSRTAFMYNAGGDPRAGLAWTAAPEPSIVDNGSQWQWDFMAFNPTGDRIAAVYYGDMWLADVTPNIVGGVASLGPIPQARVNGMWATQPNWSPDGSTLAYILRYDTVDWQYSAGDLMTMPWDPLTQTFGNPTTLKTRGPDGGTDDTLSYPSWSPDSRWIAVGSGPDNRGTAPANIHLVDPLTGDATQMLKGAPHGSAVVPSFSPFIEGGKYWLLFYNSAPYGHITATKQLWVMAIDTNMTTGTDGSHPAFWLPGQDWAQINITGYWAPAPCSASGQDCSTNSDCCLGLTCLPDGNGANKCTPANQCSLPGDTCVTNADCCESSPVYICYPNLNGDNVCQLQPN